MPLVQISLPDGHKRFSYIEWFRQFQIADTLLVPGNEIILSFPPASNEGLPYEGYYEISVFITCSEWGPGTPPILLSQLNPHTLAVKGSSEIDYHFIDVSLSYANIVGETTRVYNHSLQGTSLVNVSSLGGLCSNKKVFVKFTGTQIDTIFVQISGGYVNLKYLGANFGDLCQN